MAGVIPGIILALLFAGYNLIKAMRNPNIAPEPDTLGDVTKINREQIISGLLIIALIILVLGGIWGGIFTATEAAGVGALASFFYSII